MKRRALVVALASSLLTPIRTGAQQSPLKVHRVALILTTSPPAEMAGPEPLHPGLRAFLREMRARGYVEGRNLVFDRRSAEGVWERTSNIMRDLVRLKTDVVVVANTDLALRAATITRDIPIVVLAGDDLVRTGLARSLARPAGNVTGGTTDVGAGTEVKRLELFVGLLPKAPTIAFVGTKQDWENHWGRAIRDAAPALGVNLFHVESTARDYKEAFSALQRERPDAFWISRSVTAYAYRALIGQFAVDSRLPSCCGGADTVEHGCLMSYGLNVNDLFVRGAGYADRILKGAKAGDLPIEQPSKFELVLNLRTARHIGLIIPHSVLVRADRVIE